MTDLPPPSYAQTIEAVQECGVARSRIAIKYEDYLQADEVRISDIGQVTDERLRCIREAVHPFYILTLEKPDQQRALYDLEMNDARPAQLRDAIDWARTQGKAARIPSFEKGKGVAHFARDLERSCDLESGSILADDESEFLALPPAFHSSMSFEKSGKVLECVMQMFAASNAYENGLRFGFIGNEEKK